MSIKENAVKLKLDSPKLASLPIETRNLALTAISDALQIHKEEIFTANRQDCERASLDGIAAPVLKRLKFDEAKLSAVLSGIRDLIALPDPLGRILLSRELDTGLTLYRISCPIGVIGVIFEARPDALIQISTLCLKSGNCAILKGGSETMQTNRVLFEIIYKAAVAAGLPEGCLLQAEARSEISELLECHESVDLLIPRGSNAFVQYIMNNTKIPVMGHADGICHIYVDKDADLEQAIPIILDAKTQYSAVCNAVETLLIHRSIAGEFLPKLQLALNAKNVRLRGSKEVCSCLSQCEELPETGFRTEYLDYIVSAGLVGSVDEAIEHINRYGSHHTDCILTLNDDCALYFMQLVDSANCFQNCSTRFSDGYRYGFGAEVGISTGKLHARGPVGLDGLVTYKYKLFGHGQIVADYAEGRKEFHFKDI